MSAIQNRYEATMFIACKNTNPNGDPDMNNAPRQDVDTLKGYMTGVSIKRRVRDYIQTVCSDIPGMDIFVKSGTDLNVTLAKVKTAAGITPVNANTTAPVSAAQTAMCGQFFDVRAFGAVMSTGPNNGQVRGPVQITFAESLDPIDPQDIGVTRVASSDASGKTPAEYEASADAKPVDKLRTIGRQQFIPFGLYQVKIYISANAAQKTGFSEEDLNKFFEALANMYDTLHTSSKGEIGIAGPVIIFKHEGDPSLQADEQVHQAKLGRAASETLFRLVKCEKKPGVTLPRDYTDYACVIDASKLPAGVRVGYRQPFADSIVWDKLPDNETWMEQV